MRPQSMIAYLSNYSWHFNEPLCRYAVSLMYYKEGDKEKEVEYVPKEKVEELRENVMFEGWQYPSETHAAIRLVTSWGTTEEEVDAFLELI